MYMTKIKKLLFTCIKGSVSKDGEIFKRRASSSLRSKLAVLVAFQILAGRLVRLVPDVLELPVRRLLDAAGDGSALVLDDADIDDA